jgi:hypothetical protein
MAQARWVIYTYFNSSTLTSNEHDKLKFIILRKLMRFDFNAFIIDVKMTTLNKDNLYASGEETQIPSLPFARQKDDS